MLRVNGLFFGAPGARGEPAPGDFCLGLVIGFDSIEQAFLMKHENTPRPFPIREADSKARWKAVGEVAQGSARWYGTAKATVAGTDVANDMTSRAALLIKFAAEHLSCRPRSKRPQLQYLPRAPQRRKAVHVSRSEADSLPSREMPKKLASTKEVPSASPRPVTSECKVVRRRPRATSASGASLQINDCPVGCFVFAPRQEATGIVRTWCRVLSHMSDGRLLIDVPHEEPQPLSLLTLQCKAAMPCCDVALVRLAAEQERLGDHELEREEEEEVEDHDIMEEEEPAEEEPQHEEEGEETEEEPEREDGHDWIGERVRTLVRPTTSRASEGWRPERFVDGTVTSWKPAGRERPAWWHVVHDDGNEEDVGEADLREAIRFWRNRAFSTTFHELITSYVQSGVREVDGESVLHVNHERLPEGMAAEVYFASRDVYVGNAYGHLNSKMYLASSLGSHMTISRREPFVCVLPKMEKPRAILRLVKYTDSGAISHAKVHGWPMEHPATTSISQSGDVKGRCIRSRAVVLAGLLWPKTYEFVLERETLDDADDVREVRKNDGVVAHIVGNAVAPVLAAAVMRAAAAASPVPITSLVDLCCGGGGFSWGAAEALPSLRAVDGVDNSGVVLRNFVHNLSQLLGAMALVAGHQQRAPFDMERLGALLGRPLGPGLHLHMSPPCQGFVHASAKNGGKFNIRPCLKLMLAAAIAGCTCTMEENKDATELALRWLQAQAAADRARFYVYKVDALDYGCPAARLRLLVTTFPLSFEVNLNL